MFEKLDSRDRRYDKVREISVREMDDTRKNEKFWFEEWTIRLVRYFSYRIERGIFRIVETLATAAPHGIVDRSFPHSVNDLFLLSISLFEHHKGWANLGNERAETYARMHHTTIQNICFG
jgi:hypothetical protein